MRRAADQECPALRCAHSLYGKTRLGNAGALAFGAAAGLCQSLSRIEHEPTGEAARGLDDQPLTLPLERPSEVLEVIEQLLFGYGYRTRKLLERGGTVAERSLEAVAHGLSTRCGSERPRPSAIVAPVGHERSMLAGARASKRGLAIDPPPHRG